MFWRLFKPKTLKYNCSECGEIHYGLPSFSPKYPNYYFDIPESQRKQRVQITEDFCVIRPDENDEEETPHFFIRALLEIPILGMAEPLSYGVWVSQSKESYERYVQTFDQDQSEDGSFGWFTVDLPFYNIRAKDQDLVNLECEVQWGQKGQRPKVVLWENEHPLVIDQNNGIKRAKAIKLATQLMHDA